MGRRHGGKRAARRLVMAKERPDFSHLPVTIRRWKLGKRQTMEIHRDFVKVTEKGLFATNWVEPVSAFEGVRRRTIQIEFDKVYLVELVHPDKKKTLRLCDFVEKPGDANKLREEAARALNLPALTDVIAPGVRTLRFH